MDREAVTAPVAMSIAVALFLGLFATLALTSNEVGGSGAAEATDAARLHAQARSLLDQMLRSPGYSEADDGTMQDWIDRENDLVRLGLRDVDGTGLSFAKFEKLRLAPYAADPNDVYVNYEEARAALGFDDAGLGFHIRAKPSLKSIQDVLENGERDPNLRITYLADSTGDSDNDALDPPTVVLPPSCTDAGGKTYTVSARFKNSGTQETQFSAYVTINPQGGGNGDHRTEWIHGPKVAPGAEVTLSTTVPIDASYCAADGVITFDLWDPSQRWISPSTTLASSVGGEAHDRDLLVDPSKSHYVLGDPVVVTYDGQGLGNSQSLTFRLKDAADAVVAELAGFTAGNTNQRSITIASGASGDRTIDHALGVGSYTAELTDGTVTVTDQVHVFASGDLPEDFTPTGATGSVALTAGAKAEVAMLEKLVEQFCPYVYDKSPAMDSPPAFSPRCDFDPHDDGDVVPDQKNVLNNVLPLRLVDAAGAASTEHVSTLVVGSNVDHQAMTSASAKHAVRDWVLAGGTLIVYGSQEQAVQWLQPIFHAGIEGGGSGLGTPDPDHPLLHVSDTLDYLHYDDHGRVWSLKDNGAAATANDFTSVTELDKEPTLAISDPGAYGEGTVILTTWTPFDLFKDGSDPATEAPKLVNNLLMQSYRGLFLDFGPPLPEGQIIAPATSKAQVFHDELGRLVSLDVSLFVFPQG